MGSSSATWLVNSTTACVAIPSAGPKSAVGRRRNTQVSVLPRYPAAPRRLLTVDEYHQMGEVGVLTDDDRVELIEGELVAMARIGSEHVAAINALNRLLVLAVGDRGIVSVWNPVRLTQRTEQQLDFAVLKSRDTYRTALPRPEDTMLAVEVSNTSLDYDRKVKVALYARSGIPEVWIVNLAAEEVEVYQAPVADSYTSVLRACRSDIMTINAIPRLLIPVVEIFA
jgi:Uma2 family endonuclease